MLTKRLATFQYAMAAGAARPAAGLAGFAGLAWVAQFGENPRDFRAIFRLIST
jgi:hypothetical protein